MIRNLKVLGLALAAVFALSAVAASVAAAHQGTLTSTGPVTLKGTETGAAGSNALTMSGLSVECPGSTFTGHKYNVTPHAPIPVPATTFTITPHFKQGNHNCRTNPGNFPTTIDMNGCDYVLHLGVTTGGVAHTYGVTYDIVCPVEKEITITTWTNTTDHTNNVTLFCTLHIPPQNGLPGEHATDTTNGNIDLTGTMTGVRVVQTKSEHAPVLCPAKETTTASWHTDVTVSGVNGAGGATSISITHP